MALNISPNVSQIDGKSGSLTATDILNTVKTVDGSGSGLDADLLDGNNSSYFQQALVSGTNIKTLNGQSILGSGNLIFDAGVVRNLTEVTPTTGQTVFNVTYTVGLLDVFINGVKLATADFTATNGTSVTLATSGLTTSDIVSFVAYEKFSVVDQTFTRTTIVGLKEYAINLSTDNIDLALANVFYKTISTTTTFTVSNVPVSGIAASFILDLTNAGSATITWWSNVRWTNGVAPVLTASGRDILGFITYDAGANWNGLILAKDIK